MLVSASLAVGMHARLVLEEDALGGALGPELEVGLGGIALGREVRRLGGELPGVDRRVERGLGVVLRPECREREEVEVGEVGRILGRRECAGHEQAEQVHPGLLLDERVGGVGPVQARVVLCVEGQDLLPLLEDRRDLRVGPLLLARHQADMEVVAVEPEVEDVEGAHRRPALLVAESDRRQAVGLHLGGQGLQVVPRLRDRVALVLEEALPVEDGPRVVVHRDRVDLAVVADRPTGRSLR